MAIVAIQWRSWLKTKLFGISIGSLNNDNVES